MNQPTSHQGGGSQPRPIHQPPREIRSTPDDLEPSHSYEHDSYFAQTKEDAVEDAFHRKNNYKRRDSDASGRDNSNARQQSPPQNYDIGSMRTSGISAAAHAALHSTSGGSHSHHHHEPSSPQSSSQQQQSQQQQQHPPSGSFWRMEGAGGSITTTQSKTSTRMIPRSISGSSSSTPPVLVGRASANGQALLNNHSPQNAAIEDSHDLHHSWNDASDKAYPPRTVSAPASDGGISSGSKSSFRKKKESISRQRNEARRQKLEYQSESDMAHLSIESANNCTAALTSGGPTGGSADDIAPFDYDPTNTTSSSGSNPFQPTATGSPNNAPTMPANLNSPLHRATTANSNTSSIGTPSLDRQETGGSIAGSSTFGFGVPPAGVEMSRDISVADSVAGDPTAAAAGSSLLFGKTANGSVLLGKSSSLIFPTGVEPAAAAGRGSSIGTAGRAGTAVMPHPNNQSEMAANNLKRRKINLLLDQCESVRFPFKKKLILSNMHLSASDIPVKDLCGTPLGQSLHKLSLAGNRLGYIPAKLVTNLPMLKHLDMSQCELHHLPETWYLPTLRRLNLSHNRLTDFPEEGMLEGLPELQELNMYGNKVAEIIIPHSHNNKKRLLSKLETLNLGYNDLSYLPDDLDMLKSLRNLKVMNNFLEKVPMRVCDMDLKWIDVSSNPVIQPPIETCERGISSMKRYYQCLRMEANQPAPAAASIAASGRSSSYYEDLKKGVSKTKKKVSYGLLSKAPKFIMPVVQRTPSTQQQQQQELPGKAQRQGSDGEYSVAAASITSTTTSIATTTTQITPPKLITTKSAESGLPTRAPVLPPSSSSARKLPYREDELDMKMPAVGRTKQKYQAEDHFALSDDHSAPLTSKQSHQVRAQHEEFQQRSAQPQGPDRVTVNDTLKVIFVGMAMVGKTSMIKRLIEGKDAIIPTHDERTVGVDIYAWDSRKDKRFEHIDSRIQFQDKELISALCASGDSDRDQPNINVKFSVWDFAGQHVYHATHELFFSPHSLYVLVWDMGATNRDTMSKRKESASDEKGAFALSYDSDEEETEEEEEGDEDNFEIESEARRAERALERDIDEKVQFWVDCIQSSAPGAAILPVASFNDYFDHSLGGTEEAKRRCIVMKKRLMKHEERRVEGIKQRLQGYLDQNRADDEGAARLRKLLSPYHRPKLIFGDDDDPVVRVSGSMYTGFDILTERIVDIATGRCKGEAQYPIFRGHVGARIPRMRLEVREAVRTMRNRFKVVEWGYFLSQLRERGLTSVEDISDALHFLTNVGELSYFGAVYNDKQTRRGSIRGESIAEAARGAFGEDSDGDDDDDDDDDDEDDEDDYDDDDDDNDEAEGGALLSIDETSTTGPITENTSLTGSTDWNVNGLSQFVFLNPRWLVAAVACILRHDLDREIQETRRAMSEEERNLNRFAPNFYDAHLNCPVITARDACMLWQAKKITKKAAERALKSSPNSTMTPFEFLQLLLIRFGVFVPIDLSISKAFLGGKDYAGQEDLPAEVDVGGQENSDESPLKAKFFFLPSLLGPGEPTEAWTYKNSESWKTTLAHSVLFPDGVPPGLMEKFTASVLSNVYAAAHRSQLLPAGESASSFQGYKGRLSVKEVLCWRTAFYLKLGTQASDNKESIVEIFTHLVDRDSHLCVGSDFMGVGMRRLITSAKGQVGDKGRKIWEGGYLLVLKSVRIVMEDYGGLEYETQGFCTECLAKNSLSKTSAWDFTVIRAAMTDGDGTMRCKNGHRVETNLIAGPSNETKKGERGEDQGIPEPGPVPVNDLLRGVVVVGLFDGKTRKVVRVGSGFIVDRKRGLIVTASHTLMNIWGDKNTPFGENYYGLRQGKVVIGVIPRKKDSDNNADGTMALFRYFAVIVAKDPSIEKGECHLDACVLRITTRMENDVGGDGDGCGDEPEMLLLNNPEALKKERLQQLKITEKVELDEQVRILGYNQGGEGLLGPGESLNRYVDFARGYVCKMFSGDMSEEEYQRHRFKPRSEIVIICPTIGGHSGGPCVNQQGEVIGILSRADPAERQRCYLVPTYEWKNLVKQAKHQM